MTPGPRTGLVVPSIANCALAMRSRSGPGPSCGLAPICLDMAARFDFAATFAVQARQTLRWLSVERIGCRSAPSVRLASP
jgi:hypothetical protein